MNTAVIKPKILMDDKGMTRVTGDCLMDLTKKYKPNELKRHRAKLNTNSFGENSGGCPNQG